MPVFKRTSRNELSIPQLEAIRNYYKQKVWKLVHEYINAGKSVKTDDLRNFQYMIATTKRSSKDFNPIITHKSDHFSRNRDNYI